MLVHAGVADRRMWNPQWPALTAAADVVRLDLRGFGESDTRPDGPLDHVADVIDTLTDLAVTRCHLVGASYGAGVVTEVALARPDLVASLMLSAPGGVLLTVRTPDLADFFAAERAALTAGDLPAAVEANLRAWVDGPGQPGTRVRPELRAAVGRMQLRAFELAEDWGEPDEVERQPPAVQRLGELAVPTLVLDGDLDIEAIRLAAADLSAGIPGARRQSWPGVAHLPSMEQPEAFLRLLLEHCRAAS